jgi:nitroimidazol reductase NimA-like FMN-containing flavoprotein (pyridoxamine 5'-phosphate oxidase superfamily)
MSISMTRQEREAFLADIHIGVVSIADGERGPLTAPVWYAYEPGGEISFVTGADSRKARALAGATRASFLVQSEELPYQYVSVEGPVTVEVADLDKHTRPIAHRYLGQEAGDGYLASTRGEGGAEEALVRIRPERWLTVDYRKRFGGS